ncbi:hypothetical protein [Oceaniglobus roseus]|uniref:hypothetical protein n=1 Tax=Oceaniglobus roseus TaxID=1737570 RepID=UPI000C7F05CA|nr:hypothetical protein [Kandeliimicrobium roseum]
MTRIALSALCLCLLAAPLAAEEKKPVAPPLKKIELYCTDKYGQRHELGEVMCIVSSSCQIWMGKCDMSQNNVMWRKVQDGCPGVSLSPDRPMSRAAG